MHLNAREFSLDIALDELKHPKAIVIRSIAAKENNTDPIKCVTKKSRKWVYIMTKETAQN
jgi:hypothetical protein